MLHCLNHPFPTRRSSDLAILADQDAQPEEDQQQGRADLARQQSGEDADDDQQPRQEDDVVQVAHRMPPSALPARDRPERRRSPTVSPNIHRRSEEHTSELQSLMSHSYSVFCLKKK